MFKKWLKNKKEIILLDSNANPIKFKEYLEKENAYIITHDDGSEEKIPAIGLTVIKK